MEKTALKDLVDIEIVKPDKNNKYQKVNFFHLCVLIFVLGCLIGYIVEVIIAFIKCGHFVNKQGMIYGPFNQIYGFGALIYTICLYPFKNSKKYILLLMGTFIGGLFEYLCSVFQEIVFKSTSWQYSKLPLSIGGRTNLLFALGWGILGLLFITFVLPLLIRMINKCPTILTITLAWGFFVLMIFNMIISSAASLRQTERHKGNKANNAIEIFLDKHYDDDLLKKVYPTAKHIK